MDPAGPAVAKAATPQEQRQGGEHRLVKVYAALSIPELRGMAESGDHVAEYVLASMYRSNAYERRSYLPLLRASAEAGVQHARSLYGFEFCVDGCHEAGGEMIRSAAGHGCGEGAYLLFKDYQHRGQGREGLEFLELAARCSYIPACKDLSRLYARGNLVKSSEALSEKWMKFAADMGDADAMYRYACALLSSGRFRCISAHLNKIRAYLRKAVDLGHIEAAFRLARLYCCTCGINRGRSLIPGCFSSYRGPDYDYCCDDLRGCAVGVYLKVAAKSPELMERVYQEHIDLGRVQGDALLKGLAALGHAESMFHLGNIAMDRNYNRMCPDALHWYQAAARHGHRAAAAVLSKAGIWER